MVGGEVETWRGDADELGGTGGTRAVWREVRVHRWVWRTVRVRYGASRDP